MIWRDCGTTAALSSQAVISSTAHRCTISHELQVWETQEKHSDSGTHSHRQRIENANGWQQREKASRTSRTSGPRQQTSEQFFTLRQSILNEHLAQRWQQHSTCVGGCHGLSVFTDRDFWKCSWAHAVISMRKPYLCLLQWYLGAWRSQASNIEAIFQHHLLRTEISPDFDDFMHRRWWDIYSSLLHWGALFWNCYTTCRLSFFQIGDHLPIFTFEKICLSKMLFFIPSHVPDLLRNKPNYEMLLLFVYILHCGKLGLYIELYFHMSEMIWFRKSSLCKDGNWLHKSRNRAYTYFLLHQLSFSCISPTPHIIRNTGWLYFHKALQFNPIPIFQHPRPLWWILKICCIYLIPHNSCAF